MRYNDNNKEPFYVSLWPWLFRKRTNAPKPQSPQINDVPIQPETNENGGQQQIPEAVDLKNVTGEAKPEAKTAPSMTEGAEFKNEPAETVASSYDEFTEIALPDTYKRLGFFAALSNLGIDRDYKLNEVINEVTNLNNSRLALLNHAHSEKMDALKLQLSFLNDLLKEKETIKKTFVERIIQMETEYAAIRTEIANLYIDLRKEIKNLGTDKEGMVLKRIEQFQMEVDKIVGTYQNVERIQNENFKHDFAIRNLRDDDKKFYYDYREKLNESFNEVQKRMRALEREGLNISVSGFLIWVGWIAAFTTSWFFSLWYPPDTAPGSSTSSNLIVYILDNLRRFVINHHWWQSVLVFGSYLVLVMVISWICYKVSYREKFIEQNQKQDTTDNSDSIIFNLESENLINTQFKANTWYELWLKLTPFLSAILGLVAILAVGAVNNDTYKNLSDMLSMQVVGLLLPVAFSSIFYLYITKVVELRVIKSEENPDELHRSFGWEIVMAAICFLVLVLLLLFYNSKSTLFSKQQIGAWGFLTGCISTGVALSYGYRLIAINDSFNTLVQRLHEVSTFIEKYFYPFHVSYQSHSSILYRMRVLYHTLLNLSESRNNVAMRLLNPNFKSARGDNNKSGSERNENRPPSDTNLKQSESSLYENWFVRKINKLFRSAERKWKELLHQKDKEIAELKKDSIDIDESTYFPESAAKVTEIKMAVEDREKRLSELKEEIYGYYRNEKTYASILQQIENIEARKTTIAKSIEQSRIYAANREKVITNSLENKKIFIAEGYNLGTWYNKKNNPLNFN